MPDADPAAQPAVAVSAAAPAGGLLRLLGLSRLVMLIAIGALFAGALGMLVYGLVETAWLIRQVVAEAGRLLAKEDVMLGTIKIIDLFLLAAVLYIAAVGLFQLFVDKRLPMPAWLHVQSIDDLKRKLIEMVVTVLGVEFLGQVVAWNGTRDLLPLGIAIGAVVCALTYFLSQRAPGKPAGKDAGKGAGKD